MSKFKEMEAKELRINNLVFIDNPEFWPQLKNVPLLVVGVDSIEDSIGLNHPNKKDNYVIPAYSQFSKYISPIPLTPEWLERFGFVEDGKINSAKVFRLDYKRGYEKCISIIQGNGYYTMSGLFGTLEIQYVHQLQNLIFTLTGQELQLKQLVKQ